MLEGAHELQQGDVVVTPVAAAPALNRVTLAASAQHDLDHGVRVSRRQSLRFDHVRARDDDARRDEEARALPDAPDVDPDGAAREQVELDRGVGHQSAAHSSVIFTVAVPVPLTITDVSAPDSTPMSMPNSSVALSGFAVRSAFIRLSVKRLDRVDDALEREDVADADVGLGISDRLGLQMDDPTAAEIRLDHLDRLHAVPPRVAASLPGRRNERADGFTAARAADQVRQVWNIRPPLTRLDAAAASVRCVRSRAGTAGGSPAAAASA